MIEKWFEKMASKLPEVGMLFRGRGLIYGLTIFDIRSVAPKHMRNRPEYNIHRRIVRNAFDNGLIVETTGAYDNVVKMLPPLIIEESLLRQGLDILENSIAKSLQQPPANGEEEIPFPELMMHT